MSFYAESINLPDSTFLLLRDLIKEKIGIFYDNSKKEILADKLTPLLIEKDFDSFLDYYYFLKYDPEGEKEWDKIADVLSVQETYFFREYDHIKSLVENVIPDLVKEKDRIKIWSSACATGEEPLSIAISLNEKGWFEKAKIDIYASDISISALQKAKEGIYKERSFRNFPKELMDKYFKKVENGYKIDPLIHKKIIWRKANLLVEDEIKDLARSTVIFCRNVFIYFADDTIVKILNTFYKYMENPGYLYVGSAESLLRFSHNFDLQIIGGAFVYVKK